MYIRSLELKDYRNYKELNISFDPHINILYGNNAQGKTNILEALFMSATTKSHRGSKDKEMVNFDKDECHIRTIVDKDDIAHKIDMHLRKRGKKNAAIDGLNVKRSSELVGMLNIVFFSPEDLSIIKSGPDKRRRFLDVELCQLDKIYLQYLSKYNKIIFQRNNLLKQIYYDKSLITSLDVWDEQLVDYGSYIIKKRKEFIDDLKVIIKDKHDKLTGSLENVTIDYEFNVDADAFNDKLKEARDADLKRSYTSVGPHRDDICFYANDIDIRKYGSQGQQRSLALSLKLAEIEIVKRQIKEAPILLLDDVLSELDSDRQNYLLNSIDDVQVIITCTGLDEFVNQRLPIDKVYHVVNGTVTLKEE
ncbi:MAG: DNA replication/repair protein RecF [Lachnospiraceae bacterium]|nr:DNA replication/repair protein RecF [Lachnospiraceae bacterium]